MNEALHAKAIQTENAPPPEKRFVTFYGAGDDLVEVEGTIPGCDEYPTDDATFGIGGLWVRVKYESDGVWSIAVKQVDEDVPVAARNISMGVHKSGYSMTLTLEVPAGSFVSMVDNQHV